MPDTSTLPGPDQPLDRLAGHVAGVQAAATVVDPKLTPRTDASPVERPAPQASTALPSDRLALCTGPELNVPTDAPTTLGDALLTAAHAAPHRGVTLVRSDGEADHRSYSRLRDAALQILGGLQRLGLRPGEAVLLQCGDNGTYLTAFWACILGGFLPTPVGIAPDYGSENAVTRKLHGAWRLLDRPVILADAATRPRVEVLCRRWSDPARVATVEELAASAPGTPARREPDDPVLNLLTSGSTGTPKCVQHASRSILARTHATIAVTGFTDCDVSLNWMPLDHVGGIVMYHIRDVVLQCDQVHADTESFVRRPLNWLDWMDRFEASNTWAPNFAFALVNQHAGEVERGRWDLVRMRHILNGGEAVVPATAYRFLELLAPHGLAPDAMVPSWGMSETSSGVTFSRMQRHDRSVGVLTVDPASMGGPVAALPANAPGGVDLCDLGRPIPGVRLRVVDDADRPLREGRVGRLQVGGATLMRGYYRNEAANESTMLADGWFDTGDLGLLHAGRLVLTGRNKDMVIVNGANYPAHDIEAVVEGVAGVMPACAAVCSVHDESTGSDAVVVFFVPTAEAGGDLDRTVGDIRAALAREIALRPQAVVPLAQAEFPRTDSGKIQRGELLSAWREGRFTARLYGVDTAPPRAADEDWLLRPGWMPETSESEADSTPVLLYAAPGSRVGEAVVDELPAGTHVVWLVPGAEFRPDGEARVELVPDRPDHHDWALAAVAPEGPLRVVYAWEAESDSPSRDPAAVPVRLATCLAALARSARHARVTVLTRGALSVSGAEEVRPERAALAGLVRTASTEGTVATIRLVDVAESTAAQSAARAALAAHPSEVVVVRDGTAYAECLRRVDPATSMEVPERFLGVGGVVLVTGGLGALGRALTEHLLVAQQARVRVVGRRPESEAARPLAELRELGEVRYAAVDVADAESLVDAVAAAEQEWQRRLELVVHCAGDAVAPQWSELSRYELCQDQDPWLRRMLRPKLGGAVALESLLDTRPETAVVLYSSVNVQVGGSAFGAYAAANAALHGAADRWATRGHPVRCLGWSMWAGGGRNEGSPLVAAALRRGLREIDPSHGIALALAALNQPHTHVYLGVDPANAHLKARLAPEEFSGAGTLLAVVPESDADPEELRRRVAAALAATGAVAQVVLVPRIPRHSGGAVDVAELLALQQGGPSPMFAPEGPTEVAVARLVADHLGVAEVGREDSFFALGGDSIRAIQFVGRLSTRFRCDLRVSLLYEHPTVRELAAAIDAAVGATLSRA